MTLPNVSDGSRRAIAPRPHELEVSLFGPGYGECVALHIGRGEWVIVDSCLDVHTRSPSALDYLRLIGVDPSKDVVQVIATHWHDDHVGGLSTVLRECRHAEFVCSDAFREKEFLTLIAAYSKSRSVIGSGVDELAQVLDTLLQTTGDLRRFRFAMADQCLWQTQPDQDDAAPESAVFALSPSSYSCVMGKVALGKLLPHAGPMRRVPSFTPNHAALVLWVRVGKTMVLLGSDLEETGQQTSGWLAILRSRTRPQGKAVIYKVAHHGSASGDTPDVWSTLLESDPVAALTPFVQGRTALPTEADKKRICHRTTRAYATALPSTRKSLRRPAAVEKTIREVARTLHPVCTATGHIRIRSEVSPGEHSEPRVELFNGALKIMG